MKGFEDIVGRDEEIQTKYLAINEFHRHTSWYMCERKGGKFHLEALFKGAVELIDEVFVFVCRRDADTHPSA